MGTFAKIDLNVDYKDEAKEEDIEKFLKEIKDNKELCLTVEDMNFIHLSSGRVQNLDYQAKIFEDICKRHKKIIAEVSGTFMAEYSSFYYNPEEEE